MQCHKQHLRNKIKLLSHRMKTAQGEEYLLCEAYREGYRLTLRWLR